MPELLIDRRGIEQNASWIRKLCAERQLDVVGVVKCCDRFAPLIELLQDNGITRLGLSRASAVGALAPVLKRRPMLITMPSLRNSEHVVRLTSESLNSEISIVDALAEAASRTATEHRVIVMIELGELREGVEPKDALDTARRIVAREHRHFRFGGVGANLGCNGVKPDERNLGLLNDIVREIERRLCPVETVSLGGSVMLDWVERGLPVGRVNQLRVGEAIFLGTIPNVPGPHPSLRQDAIVLRGEVLEVKEKRVASDDGAMTRLAGNESGFRSVGVRRRAILDFGVANTVPSGLTAADEGIRFVMCSSDYSVFDVTDCENVIRPGDVLHFHLNYRAAVQSFLCPYSPILMS